MGDRFFGSHELRADDEPHETSTDRSFGLVFSGFCAVVGLVGLMKRSAHWPYWLGAAALFAILAVTVPRGLAPLNKLWTKFGLVLYGAINPILMGLMFFGCITPIGYWVRLSGRDLLNQRFDAKAKSYWIVREEAAAHSFKNQF